MRAAAVFTAVDVLTRLERLPADQAAPQVGDRSKPISPWPSSWACCSSG